MNEIERTIKLLNRISTPMREMHKSLRHITVPSRVFNSQIREILPPQIANFQKVLGPQLCEMERINQLVSPFVLQLNQTMEKLAEQARRWQKERQEDVIEMADNGWYPNWHTFDFIPTTEPNSLDDLMVMQLETHWEIISDNLLKLCESRREILQTAIDLHKAGNYVASIPLFLSQADGICCETLKVFLFTGDGTKEKLEKILDSDESEIDGLTRLFLEPYKLPNHHNMGIRKYGVEAKNKAPNRNGILHGHRKHLDYGTKINSLKCFSLLSFIVFTMKDLLADELSSQQASFESN